MRIGVLSDTHLNVPSDKLIKIIDMYFKDTDMILHAGDIVGEEVLNAFSGRDLRAVMENMDSAAIKKILPRKQVIKIGKFKIGLTHGAGSPTFTEMDLMGEFEDVDCIVYGHTHSPANHLVDGILFFNPGALAGRRNANGGSIGILEIDDKVRGRIIRL